MRGKDILKYRNVWIGLAMIWIVWYHSKLIPTGEVLSFVRLIGYGGVDICLFASGVGCYFSLTKDADVCNFMKRRIVRLAPTYCIFILIWMLYKSLTSTISLQAMLGNFLGIQNLTGQEPYFNWYISALVILYLLAPYLKGVADRMEGVAKQLLIIVFLILISIPFWNSPTYIITITRIPIFYIGMIFGKTCKKDDRFTIGKIALYIMSFVGGMILMYYVRFNFTDLLWNYGLYWYPFILITPGLCVMISCIMHIMQKIAPGRFVTTVFSKVGQYSFELYLVHIFLFEILDYMMNTRHLIKDTSLVWWLALAGVFAGCALLRLTVICLSKCMPHRASRI